MGKPADKTVSDKAVYYDTHLKGIPLDILARNKDGTVNLGLDGKVIVRVCPVVKEPKHGYCTLGAEPVAAEKVEGDPSIGAEGAGEGAADEPVYKPKI